MEVNEQNDDEMILVVVGDDDGTKYETSESPERETHVPISAKIDKRDDFSTEEDVNEIYKLAEFIKIKPDVKILDEEYLSQEEEEEFIQDDSDTKNIKTFVSQKKHAQRKTQHAYLVDEEDILSPKNKKGKANVVPTKNKKTNVPKKPKHARKNVQNVRTKQDPTSVSEEDDFEIEFLEDDAVVSSKNTLEENFTEYLNNPPKRNRRKTIPPKKHVVKKEEEYISEEDIKDDYKEDYTEIEFLDNPSKKNKRKTKVSPKIHVVKKKEEYISEEDIEEDFIENDYNQDFTEKEFLDNPPKKNKRKTKVSPNKLVVKKEEEYISEEDIEEDFIENDYKEDYTKIEFLDNPPKKNKRKTMVSPKKHVVKKEEEDIEEDFIENDYTEDFTEIEFLDDSPKKNKRKTKVSPKQSVIQMEEDDYIPEEEEELDEDFMLDDYVPPRGRKKKPTRRPTKSAPSRTKTVERPIRSFIAELKKNQPIFKEDTDKLVDYLVEYMRKRRPPSPPPNYCYLSDVNRYSCSYCDKEKPTESAASRHYQAAHGPRYLVCLACGSGFRSTVILYKHEKRCSAPYAEIQLIARGVFLGRKGRGRPYLTKNKFIPKEPPPGQPPKRIHIPHSQKTKYYCEQCPSYFTREILLEEHMHKHTGFRAFQCPDCPAAYVSRYQLNKHSKKHSNCKYICDHCGKVFKLKTTLTCHMDTHLPRPRFGCGRCGRRYAKRAAVRVHIMRNHMHMPPPAACPVCPKRYNRMSHVKLHMKRDHGLTLMTKRSIDRDLPYMKVEDLAGAKIVFNQDDGLEAVDINAALNEHILP